MLFFFCLCQVCLERNVFFFCMCQVRLKTKCFFCMCKVCLKRNVFFLFVPGMLEKKWGFCLCQVCLKRNGCLPVSDMLEKIMFLRRKLKYSLTPIRLSYVVFILTCLSINKILFKPIYC